MKIKQIIARFKKILKKDEFFISDLASPESTIKLPSRTAFNNDALIDFYKEGYLNSLNNMKYYDSLVLEANSLNKHVKMTCDLLFAIAVLEDDIKNSILERQVKHLINYEKLKLYLQDTFTLQNETIARLIALLEIKKEYFIISQRKKNIINNVTNRLYISLNTLLASELAIINNIQTYGNENIDFNDDIQNALAQKTKHLNWLQKTLPDDEQIIVDKDNVLRSLALIEKALEQYTYTHKDEMTPETKKDAIEQIFAIDFDMEHKNEILRQVNELERKYRAFYEFRISPTYGNIPIDETDLTVLYSIKFNAILISKNGIINTSFTNLDSIEREYYQNIIYKSYEDIIMGKNENFNWLFRADFGKAVSLFKMIFANNLSNVLNDFVLLNLLFAFDSVNGLFDFFKCKVSSSNLPLDYYNHHEVFEMDDDISLETLCYLESAIDESKDNSDNYFKFTRKYLNELYKLYLKNYPSQNDVYNMPEGIVSINVPLKANWSKLSIAERALLDKIRKDARNKIVYLPYSLKKLNDDLFIDVPIKGIIFNEGLEYVYGANWLSKLQSLVIPSTLKDLCITAYQTSYIESITFNISQNNAPVLNEDFVLKLFYYFINFGWQLNEEKNNIMPPRDLKEIIIHLNELNENICIHLNSLSFNYDVRKNGSDISRPYVRQLINYINYILTQVRKRFNLMQKALPDEQQIEISCNIPAFLKDLEIIDKRLQKYRQENIDEVNKIRTKLEMQGNNMGFPTINAKDFATNLAPLEPKIRLFNYYGRSDYFFLDNSLINYFYKLKFLYLTKDDVVYPFINDEMDDVEINTYLNFIEDMFYRLKNNSPFADEQYSDDTVATIKSLIEKILKNGKNIIDSEEILYDFYLLNVFLALSNFNRLLAFAKSLEVKTYNYENPYSPFTLDKNCPFSTICLIKYYESKEFIIDLANGIFKIPYDFINLFHTIYIHYEEKNHKDITDFLKDFSGYYFIPEGIISICSHDNEASNPNYQSILQAFREDAENKIIVMPNSLKTIKGDVLKVPCKSIILNEGLQELDSAIFKKVESRRLIIPSSVETIDNSYHKFTEIVFNNFDFKNVEVLRQLLFSSLEFERLPSGKLRGFLPFKLVFHYDNFENDVIIGPFLEVFSLDVYSFITKYQLIKKTIKDIEEEIKLLTGNSRKRTE